MKGRVLIIAGSDSGGGAGIEADIKTVTALGGYAMTATTALTAQDTRGVHGVLPTEPAFVARQMALVLDDLGADAAKSGMLVNDAMINAVADVLAAKVPRLPLVVDPVMVATGGGRLLEEDAVATLKRRLFPLATLVTPNIPEAEALSGARIESREAMAEAARMLLAFGCRAVLLKGGHLAGLERRRPLGERRGHPSLRIPAARDPEHARHGLHACLGHRHGLGARAVARGRGRPRARLSPGSDPHRPRLRPRPGTAQPRAHGAPVRRQLAAAETVVGSTGIARKARYGLAPLAEAC